MAFFVLAELASFNGASESEQDEEHASASSSSAADLDVIVIGVSNRSPSLCCRRLRSSVVVVSDVIVAVAIARLSLREPRNETARSLLPLLVRIFAMVVVHFLQQEVRSATMSHFCVQLPARLCPLRTQIQMHRSLKYRWKVRMRLRWNLCADAITSITLAPCPSRPSPLTSHSSSRESERYLTPTFVQFNVGSIVVELVHFTHTTTWQSS